MRPAEEEKGPAGLKKQQVIADGCPHVEQPAQGQQDRTPRSPPRCDKDHERELDELGQRHAGCDAEEVTDPALHEMHLDLRAVLLQIDEGGEGISRCADQQNQQWPAIPANKRPRLPR